MGDPHRSERGSVQPARPRRGSLAGNHRKQDQTSNSYQSFLTHARTVVEVLRDGAGWDVEYPRDIWRLHTLPGLILNSGKTADARNHLRFDRITQPWLRSLAKRWCRLRLTSGLAVGTILADMNVLTRFSRFLDQCSPTVDALASVDRPLLERIWPGSPANSTARR